MPQERFQQIDLVQRPDRQSIQEIKEKVRNTSVCLIIPPSTFLADERVFPFLGPLKVAAELKNNGNPVEILDLSGCQNFIEIASEHARSSDAAVYGLTATTPQIPAAAVIVQALRETDPTKKLILGGPHATLTHAGMIQDMKKGRVGRGTVAFQQLKDLFDTVVVGDGEMSIFPAIDRDISDNVIDASNLKSPFFIPKGELENYSYPERSLIDLDSYHYYIDGHRSFSIIAQLGCPFECGFCGGRDSQVFRIARTRESSHVIEEIRDVILTAKARGVDYSGVMFYDDELNVIPKGLESLCSGLIELQEQLGIDMRFRGFVKAELFTPEQAQLMYKAGFRVLLSGVESGSDEILATMRKHTTREINSLCVQYAHDAGLTFKSLMSIGHPGESEATIAQSVEWALDNLRQGDEIDWTIITQYPGSPYFDHSIYDPEKNAWLYTEPRSGQRLWSQQVDYTQDAEYYKGIPGEYTAYVWTDHLSPSQLVALRDQAEEKTRSALLLPEIQHIASIQFEHSMGQQLPSSILRKSAGS